MLGSSAQWVISCLSAKTTHWPFIRINSDPSRLKSPPTLAPVSAGPRDAVHPSCILTHAKMTLCRIPNTPDGFPIPYLPTSQPLNLEDTSPLLLGSSAVKSLRLWTLKLDTDSDPCSITYKLWFFLIFLSLSFFGHKMEINTNIIGFLWGWSTMVIKGHGIGKCLINKSQQQCPFLFFLPRWSMRINSKAPPLTTLRMSWSLSVTSSTASFVNYCI